MSLRAASLLTNSSKELSKLNMDVPVPASYLPWKRNQSWLALPSVAGLEKLVGLFQVTKGEGNYVSLSATGDYTVDWGDGTVENFSSGVQADHTFVYFTFDVPGTTMGPVTFQDTGDTVTRTAHGYANGDTIVFDTVVSTTGISAGQLYYVVGATANTFQVANTSGGSPIALTSDGTGTLLPYKQAIIAVTPNGGQLNTLNLHLRQAAVSNTVVTSGWLDISVEGANLTGWTMGSNSTVVKHQNLQQISLTGANSITDFSYLLNQCVSLRSIPNFSSSAGTNFNTFYNGCNQQISLPAIDTSNGTSFSGMFSGCTNLQSAPMLNVNKGTDFSSMFSSCSALKNVPGYSCGAGLTFLSMFRNCYNLERVPLFNTASGTIFTQMFQNCGSLTDVPLLNLVSATSVNTMFSGCTSLISVPTFNTPNVADFSSFFGSCTKLKRLPAFNTSSGTNFSSMLVNCTSLVTVPLFDTSHATNVSSLFSGCYMLKAIPSFNFNSVLTANGLFTNCASLETVPALSFPVATSITGLFSGCYSLIGVPSLSVPSVTSLTSMFVSCYNLLTIPNFTLPANVGAGSLITGCNSLTYIPAIDMSGLSNAASIFSSDLSVTKIDAFGCKIDHSISSCKLSLSELEHFFSNLGAATSGSCTFSTNPGALLYPAVVLASSGASGQAVLTMANTTGLLTGMQATGTGLPITTPFACSMQDSGDTVTITAHGLSNDDPVSFATIVSTTGIVKNTIYYVINKTANTFQLAATVGGAALPLTTDGTGTLRWVHYISSINPGVSVTLNRNIPATLSAASISYRVLKTTIAMLHGFSVTG